VHLFFEKIHWSFYTPTFIIEPFKIEDKADEYIVSDGLVDPTDADFVGMTPVKLSIVVDSEKDKAYVEVTCV